MISAKLLHLGDFHYPDNWKIDLIDLKDKCFPKGIPAAISQNPLRSVLKKLSSFDKDEFDSIFFCGDLTSYGDIDAYGKCALHIINALSLNKGSKNVNKTHVVAGNHDIDRLSVNEANSILEKFNCLEITWSELEAPIFSNQGNNIFKIIKNGKPVLSLFFMNSCIACGEKRYIPQAYKKSYEALLSASEGADPKSIFYEVLDTPAFLTDEIDAYSYNLDELPATCLPAIIAHHNILPQKIPRIALYSDVLNAGLLRGRLEASGRPVLYFHGHIHSQEIEVIRNEKNGGENVILISAPQIIEGFNIVWVEFNDDMLPLGCKIDLYNLSSTGEIEKTKRVKISFVNSKTFNLKGSKKAVNLLENIGTNELFFLDFHKKIQSSIPRLSKNKLSDLLQELSWFDLISIENVEHEFRHWRIKRIN